MPDFSERPINKSIFSDACEVSLGRFMPHIQPIEAKGVQLSCKNDFRQNIITCKDKQIDSFINEVNGLDFNVSLVTELTNIPHYIPIVDYRTAQYVHLPDSIQFIGISLIDIIKSGFSFKAGRLHEGINITYRNSLFENNNLKDKKILLFLTGPDTYIEGVWHKRMLSGFFEAVNAMNFYAVTGFNFSVFGGECAFSQILNLKRSLYSAYLLEQNNINSIPHVYALDQFQIKRWLKWFKRNPKIGYFTMNCQFQKSKSNIQFLIETIKYILTELPYIHIILQGFPFTQIHNFEYFLNRIHFAEKKAIKYAFGYRGMEYNNLKQKLLLKSRSRALPKINSFELIIPNIIARKKQLESIMATTIHQ
jgi:hypothetical protein